MISLIMHLMLSETTDHGRRRRGRASSMRDMRRRVLFAAAGILFASCATCAQSLVVDFTIGHFTSAVSLSVASTGEIVVLDAGSNSCIRFARDGAELARVQGTGWGASEFDSPTDVSAGFPLAIFVADEKNRRVQQFDKDLHYVQTLDDVHTADGQSIEGSFRPIASAQSPQGDLFVLDADGTRVVKFTTRLRAEREFGTYASGAGRLKMPTDLCITQDGRVAVADVNSIVCFDQFGNYLSTQAVSGGDTLRTLSASGPDVLAVSPSAITVVSAGNGSSAGMERIPAGMILGEKAESIRDAARTEAGWYVLTPKTILVCRRTQ